MRNKQKTRIIYPCIQLNSKCVGYFKHTCIMLFLTQCLKSHVCQRYLKQSCLQLLLNLKECRHFCNVISYVEQLYSNPNIRKCLNHMTEEYKNNNWNKSNYKDIIDIKNLTHILDERIQLIENIKQLNELLADADLKASAEEENSTYKSCLEEVDKKLLEEILTNVGKNDYKDVILEISAGVGGQEAMLFVQDLCHMYLGHIKYIGCSYEMLEQSDAEGGGYRKVMIQVPGHYIDKFRYEGGVHRVQRIPQTEKAGRIHTSTASVAILPVLSDIDVQLHSKDLKIEAKRSSGPGGQHVNTTNSAVRIVHLPTKTMVTAESQRSFIQNKNVALLKLRTILYQNELNKQVTLVSELRKKQMGMGYRNEKIRTYNFPQDRLTDHRLKGNDIRNIREFMKGGPKLEKLEAELTRTMQINVLLDISEAFHR